MRLIRLILMTVAFLGCWGSVYAQYQLDLPYITVDEGLTQNVVMNLLDDNRSYLCVGTRKGLNRLNGPDMAHYVFNPDDSTTLPSNRIKTCTYQTSRNFIRISTLQGLNLFHYDNKSFTRIYTSVKGLSGIQNIKGALYILSTTGIFGLYTTTSPLQPLEVNEFSKNWQYQLLLSDLNFSSEPDKETRITLTINQI